MLIELYGAVAYLSQKKERKEDLPIPTNIALYPSLRRDSTETPSLCRGFSCVIYISIHSGNYGTLW